MADVKKTIEIIFAGVDKVSGTIATVSGGISDFGTGIENISGPLADITDSVIKLDAVLLALAAGGLTYAYIKSAEFENATIELRKVLGDQPEALEEAQIAAFKLSEQYGESSAQVLLSTANFKQAGFDIKESVELTKAAMDLSIAGSIGSAEASELLVSTLKGFKAPASEAARLIDVLNEVSNSYATNVRELGIGMATLSPIANLMGFTFEETAGILTPVIEIFRSGTEASVALKMGLLKLVDDAKPVQDALTSIGVAQRDANGQLRSGKDILYDVAKAFQTAEENDKLFLASQLVGIRQAGKMVEVFDGLAKSTEITNVAMGAAGSAALEVSLRLKSAEITVDRFKQGFTNLAIVVGDQFVEAAKESIEGAINIENSLQRLVKDGTFQPVFDALGKFGEDLGDYLSAIAEVLPEAFEKVDWQGFLNALKELGIEVDGLFEGLDLTDPEDLAKVIQFVVDSLESLVSVTTGIIGPLGIFINQIINLVDEFNKLDDDTKKTTGSVLGWGKVVDSVIGPVKGLLGGLESFALGLKVLVGIEIINWIKDLTKFSKIAIPVGLIGGLAGVAAAISGIGLAVGAGVGLAKLIEAIFPSKQFIDDRIVTTKEEFDAMAKAIEEVNTALDKLDFVAPAADIKKMLEEEIPDTIINYVISGDVTDLEAALDEAGVLVKEKEPIIDVQTDAALRKTKELKEDIEEIPSEKMLEIKLKGDVDARIEKIKASADTLQTSMEWTAKLNIANIEAATKTLEAAFASIDVSIESTGQTMVGLFGSFEGLSLRQRWTLEDEIRKESLRREKAFEMQEKLTNAQINSMEAKTEALEKGEGLITITADGLEPELEAFMWKIIEKVQIRATADEAEFLLGIT